MVSLSLLPIPSDSKIMAEALKLSTSIFETVLLSALIVLFVSVSVVPATYVDILEAANCFIVPLSLTINRSASTITTADSEVSPSIMFISAPVAVIAFESFIFGLVKVLLVSVCVPDKVTTVESMLTVRTLPEPAVSIPVPPAMSNVSESKSIDNAPPESP